MPRFIWLFTTFLFVSFSCLADEYRPAYLQINQVSEENYRVLFKVPARSESQRLSLSLKFDEKVQYNTPAITQYVGGAYIERFEISKSDGLAKSIISINGLQRTSTETLVRVEWLAGPTQTSRLSADSPAFVDNPVATFLEVVDIYLRFGVVHILTGYDHLLFVACLIFIAGTWRRILITITGFTLAHSITLSLAALGMLYVSSALVEVIIALSIVFLAREICGKRRDTLTWRYPITVSSTFGLLYGQGFAGALKEVGLPDHEIPAALMSFNVGVEIGQIAFVLAMSLLIFTFSRVSNFASNYFTRTNRKPDMAHYNFIVSYSVGGLATYWLLQRTMAIVNG
ncbi:MAG: hydrogenase/urease accessory protein HupE [Planctomycetota bacterium]|jgi:hydrogenase/urease accessory protein HupE